MVKTLVIRKKRAGEVSVFAAALLASGSFLTVSATVANASVSSVRAVTSGVQLLLAASSRITYNMITRSIALGSQCFSIACSGVEILSIATFLMSLTLAAAEVSVPVV